MTKSTEAAAEQAVAPDRGGIMVFQNSTSHQPPRQMNGIVRRRVRVETDMAATKREARAYRHRKCGGQTTVTGMALVYVSHIFDHPDRTYCERCHDDFPMHEFAWDDTGESLTDWYSRYAGMFKGLDRFLGSETLVFVSIAVAAVVGAVAGLLVGGVWGKLAAIGAAILGAILAGFVGFVVGAAIKQSVCRRLLGTEDFASLE